MAQGAAPEARACATRSPTAESVDALARALFDALADRSEAPDAALPDTGMPLECERHLSAAFIRMPRRGYGTRCSTLIITERAARTWSRMCSSAASAPTGGVALLRRSTLKDWPPRYTTDGDGGHAERAGGGVRVAIDASRRAGAGEARARAHAC